MAMTEILYSLAAVLASYASGSVAYAWVLGRCVHGVDLREVGSCNIGATNLSRVAGRKWGIAAFFLDVGKGYAPVALLPWVVGRLVADPWLAPEHLAIACAVGAVLGHVFPFTLGFKGGKAVATSLGVMLGLTPLPSLLAFGVWLVTALVFRYVSLASIAGAVAFPVLHLTLNDDVWTARGLPLTVAAFLMAVLILVRHRANIGRLIAGTESKIGQKKKEQAPAPAAAGGPDSQASDPA